MVRTPCGNLAGAFHSELPVQDAVVLTGTGAETGGGRRPPGDRTKKEDGDRSGSRPLFSGVGASLYPGTATDSGLIGATQMTIWCQAGGLVGPTFMTARD